MRLFFTILVDIVPLRRRVPIPGLVLEASRLHFCIVSHRVGFGMKSFGGGLCSPVVNTEGRNE